MMKQRLVAICCSFAILVNTALVSCDDAVPSSQYNSCIASAKSNDLSMKDCIYAELDLVDRRLNTNYKRLLKHLDPNSTEGRTLVKVQLLWIQYKEANCSSLDMGTHGTAGRLSAANCLWQMTYQRNAELKSLLAMNGLKAD